MLTLSQSSDPELFQAAAISIGLLGIVVEVTIRCEPAFNLRETLTIYSIDYCLEHLHHLSQGVFVKLWLDVNSQLCHVFTSNKTLESPRDNLPEPFTSIQVRHYCQAVHFSAKAWSCDCHVMVYA